MHFRTPFSDIKQNNKNMVKYLVIIKSHFMAFPLSWRWRLLNLRSSVYYYSGNLSVKPAKNLHELLAS